MIAQTVLPDEMGVLPHACNTPSSLTRLQTLSLGRGLGGPAAGSATNDPTQWLSPADAIGRYRDRRDAGRILAEQLASYRNMDGLLVLGLARGGVPVGWEVASALHADLDVFLVRELGVPQWPELAMGALASGGGVVMNHNVVSGLHVTDEQVRAVIDSETAELNRRERAYRDGRPVGDPRGKIVILVDDGIATGAARRANRLSPFPGAQQGR
jgi:hypothetical protein